MAILRSNRPAAYVPSSTNGFRRIDPDEEVSKLVKAQDEYEPLFRALIVGESGKGKTFLLRTARKPVHIDSFDTGGSDCLLEWKNKREVVVDNSYENDTV